MSQDQTYYIQFEDLSVADANKMASELQQDLLELTPDISVNIAKDDPSTQDFGATLVLLFGTPVLVVIAKGISDYLRRVDTSITIRDGNRQVIAKNVMSKDIARITEAFEHNK